MTFCCLNDNPSEVRPQTDVLTDILILHIPVVSTVDVVRRSDRCREGTQEYFRPFNCKVGLTTTELDTKVEREKKLEVRTYRLTLKR